MNSRARWSRSCRVRGALAPRAEVVRRADEPLPEQVLPDPVHRHAAGERIPVAGEPVGQLRPAADVRPDLRRSRLDDRDEPARDRLSPVVGIAADADRDRAGMLADRSRTSPAAGAGRGSSSASRSPASARRAAPRSAEARPWDPTSASGFGLAGLPLVGGLRSLLQGLLLRPGAPSAPSPGRRAVFSCARKAS